MDPAPGALVAVHTVVRPEHEGKGIAGALVREAERQLRNHPELF